MTIGKKLLISVGSLLIMTLALGIASLNSINKLADRLPDATERTARRLKLLGIVATAGSDMLGGQRGVAAYSLAKSPEMVEQSRVLIQSAADHWQKAIDEFRPLIATEEGRQIINRLDDELNQWRAVLSEAEKLVDQGDSNGALQVSSRIRDIPFSRPTGRRPPGWQRFRMKSSPVMPKRRPP